MDCLVMPVWKGLLDTRHLCILGCLSTDGCIWAALPGHLNYNQEWGLLWHQSGGSSVTFTVWRMVLGAREAVLSLGLLQFVLGTYQAWPCTRLFNLASAMGNLNSHLVTAVSGPACRGSVVTSGNTVRNGMSIRGEFALITVISKIQ